MSFLMLSFQDPILQIYKNLLNVSKRLEQRELDINTVSLALLDLIDERVPDELPNAESLTNTYDRTIDHIKIYRENVYRCAEDIRDIYERQQAIDKMQKKVDSLQTEYNKLKNEYQNKKNTNEATKILEKLTSTKANLRELLEVLINKSENFDKFVVNRLTHAFQLYSAGLEDCALHEQLIYQELYERLSSYSQQRKQ